MSMSNLYLLHKQIGKEALDMVRDDKDARVALFQDAVYMDAASLAPAAVYALKWDVDHRGLNQRIPAAVKLISYHELIDLIVDNKVINLA
ncbi:MAG: hypothetical protein HY671_08825 [Chloroflexi bacterium]|nr:hypothetical protein [Chloroflexota bacterium]